MNDKILRSDQRIHMSFDEVVQYIKFHKAEYEQTEFGRQVLKLIKQGNGRGLRRAWKGLR